MARKTTRGTVSQNTIIYQIHRAITNQRFQRCKCIFKRQKFRETISFPYNHTIKKSEPTLAVHRSRYVKSTKTGQLVVIKSWWAICRKCRAKIIEPYIQRSFKILTHVQLGKYWRKECVRIADLKICRKGFTNLRHVIWKVKCKMHFQ